MAEEQSMRGGSSWLSRGSLKVARVWGIAVKIHWSFPIFFGVDLLVNRADMPFVLLTWGLLFLSVFLHELGHCAGARAMKGSAREIILWPLGGLAMVQYVPSPRAEFVVTIGGPLVNLALLLLALVVVFVGPVTFPADLAAIRGMSALSQVVIVLGLINLFLFLFNILPAFPMDGGRLLRSMLWSRLSWRTATLAATVTAMVFGVGFVVWGIATGPGNSYALIAIGVLVVVVSFSEFLFAKAFVALEFHDDDKMPFER